MVFWSDIDTTQIEMISAGKDRTKFRYQGGPLRFQIPRGFTSWGVSAYKSFQIDLSNRAFIEWWRDLEKVLCCQEPFKSNLNGSTLRLKVDDATYFFDENSKQTNPEVREGLLRGQELSVLVDIDSTYFFNGTWGLTCRAAQIRSYGGSVSVDEPETAEPETRALQPNVCAFLP